MTKKLSPTQSLAAAARALLAARQDQMVTPAEWDALTEALRSVEAEDRRTYEGFLEVWNDGCLAAAKAALDQEGVAYTERSGAGRTAFDVPAITAGQYGRAVEALSDAGEPGVDWNFTLD
jgi:hypothetical protein